MTDTDPLRDRIGRIVDPMAWTNEDGYHIPQDGADEVLVKADAILSLVRAALPPAAPALEAAAVAEVIRELVFVGKDGKLNDVDHCAAAICAMAAPALDRASIIEECATVAEGFPQLIQISPKHVRQVSGVDIAAAIRALASATQPAAPSDPCAYCDTDLSGNPDCEECGREQPSMDDSE
jgi:hypothetical protein